MALGSYTDLKNAIQTWTRRTDTNDPMYAAIPDFVTLAEARIARDLRIRKQVTNTTLETVAGSQSVTLPVDFLEIENITNNSTNPPRQLHVVTPEIMDEKYPLNYFTGEPVVYALLGNVIQLGPTPDAVYNIGLDYYQRLDLAASGTNWLMTYHPNVYLSAALHEAFTFIKDDDAAAKWLTKYMGDVARLNQVDDDSLRTGSTMRVRTL